ncbi:MAG: CBS domain-containing protein [Flavobacteriales bacterium]
MQAIDLISDNIPPIRPEDTGVKALKWMDEFKVSHLPVVRDRQFLGLLSDSDVLDMNAPEEPIENYIENLDKIWIAANKHYYDVLKAIGDEHLSVLPVLDEQGNYAGSISVSNLMEKMANVAAVSDPGSVLILEMKAQDYSLSQIVQIIEGNDGKVLSMYVARTPEGDLDVTLKINRPEINGIIQTFQRYGYVVKSSYHINNYYNDDMQNRYEGLMNYLDL